MPDSHYLLAMDEPAHNEHHRIHRVGWLRAAVLGANDGIVSTASIVVGVASAAASSTEILVAGIAALVAGSMSMAAGEYVSVSSQADVEAADLDMERRALRDYPEQELAELAQIYVARGLSPDLATEVAKQLTEKDALGAHARDELGITESTQSRPLQAAFASAISFAAGASLPLLAAILAKHEHVGIIVAIVTLLALAVLGLLSASVGGAAKTRATIRIVFWGAIAMAVTALIGNMVGHII